MLLMLANFGTEHKFQLSNSKMRVDLIDVTTKQLMPLWLATSLLLTHIVGEQPKNS
jgi:hypothetical protein